MQDKISKFNSRQWSTAATADPDHANPLLESMAALANATALFYISKLSI